jgi:hypothetical protein
MKNISKNRAKKPTVGFLVLPECVMMGRAVSQFNNQTAPSARQERERKE